MDPIGPKDLLLPNLIDELKEVVEAGRYIEQPGNKHPGGNISARGCDIVEETWRRLRTLTLGD